MTIRVVCPSCQKPCGVPEELRGKKVLCGVCKKPFTVPAATPAAPAPGPAQAAPAAAKPNPPPVSGRSPGSPGAQTAPAADKPSGVTAKGAPGQPKREAAGGPPAPRPEQPARRRPDEAGAGGPAPRRRAPGAGRSKGLLWAGAGVAGLALVGGAVALFIAFGPKGEDAQPAAQAKQQPEQKAADLRATVAPSPPAGTETPSAKPADPPAKVNVSNPPAKAQDPPAKSPDAPAKSPEPPAKVEQPPAEPLPAQISREAVRKVKKATAYLRVRLPGGQTAEGTGFFAAEPGIVFTNAHVLGMLQPESDPPLGVEVVLNSGEAGEARMPGAVLGVDRANDLAVLRVEGAPDRLPPPLPLASAADLVETQKVYIFGFPFGAQLGKNITVSESSVSSLRRDGSDTLSQIQVNGGMHPGNSGGPVVDARGSVVGVAVAIIKGTQINFAVPADYARLLLQGRHSATELGIPYLDGGQARLPVKLACLDPLNRVRDVQVEVWAGTAGPERPLSLQRPAVRPGDGPKQTYSVKYQGGVGTAEIPLPAVKPGQVVWIQPLLKTATGATHWAAASVYQPEGQPPLERREALLQVKFPEQATERTLKLQTTFTLKLTKGRESLAARDEMTLDALELIRADPRGADVKLAFGGCKARGVEDGKEVVYHPTALRLLRLLPAGFVLQPSGGFLSLLVTRSKQRDPLVAEDLTDLYDKACNAYQSSCLELPNRSVKPQETWTTKPVLFFEKKGQRKKEVVNLHLTCTYEGARARGGRNEAYIRLAGVVKGRQPGSTVSGKVSGFAVFDLEGGYLAEVRYRITSTAQLGSISLVRGLDSSLTRTPGNPLKIARPATGPGPRPGPGPGPQPGPGPVATSGPKLDPKEALARMQGLWKVERMEVDGRLNGDAHRLTFLFEGDRYTVIRDGKDRLVNTKVIPGPKGSGAVDVVWLPNGDTSLGIYRFSADEKGLEICMNQPRGKNSNRRPTAFTTRPQPGSGSILYVLRKTSPAPDPGAATVVKVDPKDALKRLQGVWQLQKMEHEGRVNPDPERFTILFEGNDYSFIRDGTDRVSTSKVVLDPSKGANAIDLISTANGETSMGIFRFTEGDGLEICFNPSRGRDANRRPTVFTTRPQPGSGSVLYVLKRAAPAPDPGAATTVKVDPKEALKRLQGTWQMEKMEVDGRVNVNVERFSILFEGDRYTFVRDGKDRLDSAKVVLNGAKGANAVDLIWMSGPVSGHTSLGIYRFTQDGGLEICMNQARGKNSNRRPSAFTTRPQPGSGSILYVLKRAAK